jgi:hypothetical protein
MDDSEMEWIGSAELADLGCVDNSASAQYLAFAAGIFGDAVCLKVDPNQSPPTPSA